MPLDRDNIFSLPISQLQKLSHATEPRVLAEMLDKQYREFYLNILGTAIVCLFFLLSIDGASNNVFVWIWCIAQWSLGLVHFVQRRLFLLTPGKERDYALWYLRALVIMFVSGLLWGIAPFAFFTITHELDAVVITGTAALILAGGLALVHLPGGYIAFGITAMSLLVLAIFSLTTDWRLIAYMGITGLVIMVKFSLNTNQSVADSISLRYENADLADELELANDAKSKFLATASHDLRQPLQALSLLTSAITERGNSDPAILDAMQRSVQNLNALFNSLLDISKLDAGVIKVSPQNTSLFLLLDYVFNQFKELADQKGLDYKLSCDDKLWVKTDPILTQRILANIIDNAFNNTDSGYIHIKVKRRRDVIKVIVEDTGHGIAYNELEKIFSEFYQLGNNPNQNKKGMGLGLSIVKRLAELQKHKIALSSTPSVGSNFSITLPSATQPFTLKPSKFASRNSAEPQQFGILIVENEVDIGEATNILLSTWGYTVMSAENSKQAISIAENPEHNIDLIISDFQLGENENGLNLCKVLQEHFAKNVPAIIITGNTDAATIKLMEENQITLLHKPVFPPQLRLTIENSLRQS